MAERHRLAGQARWAGMTPDERREANLPARQARGRVVDLAEQFDAFGVEVLTELRALRAEVAELRDQQVAA